MYGPDVFEWRAHAEAVHFGSAVPTVIRVGRIHLVVDSHSVRRAWAERSGEYSPDYYAYYGPNETSEVLGDTFDRVVGRDASLLELGCSSGRHLAHLHERGYTDLAGIEINRDAVTVMAQTYPELFESATVHKAAFQDTLPEFADDQFDAAFSVETLQHVHPDDEWLFAELARIAQVVVTVENEDTADGDVTYVNDDLPLYHRNWHTIFTDHGLVETATRDLGRDTLRVFAPRE